MSNSSFSPTAAAYIVSLTNILDKIHNSFNIMSPSIGIPCNMLSIFIFARLMRKSKTNMGFLYVWQCSIDLCVLLFSFLLFRSATTFGINLFNKNDPACKFLNFLRRFILHASSWLPVLITFDRFTFVLYGHVDTFRFLKSKLNLTCIIFTLFMVIAILGIPSFFFHLMKNGSCDADFSIAISSDIISNLMRTYIPFVLMIVFNILMVRKILKNNKRVLSNKETSTSSALARKEAQFTIAVIASDIYFFVMNVPLTVFYIFYDIYYYSGAFKGNILLHVHYSFAIIITGNLAYCEQTFSFFMYFAFNKIFRNELLHVLAQVFSTFRFNSNSSSIQS